MSQYLLLRALAWSGGVLSARVLFAAADILGTLAWYLVPRLRTVTLHHMRHALGPLASPRQCARAARGCVRSAARYYVDLVRGPHVPPGNGFDLVERVDGLDRLFVAIERGCGVIVVSAHLGSPESMARAFGHIGIDLMVLTEPLRPPRVHELVHALRATPGVRFMPADLGGVRAAMAHLRSGGVLAMLADRDVLGSGRPVLFFGERARLPAGPVELALRTGAALLPTFVLRTPHKRLLITFEAPLALSRSVPKSTERAADVAAGHRLLAAALERGIAGAPEQWFPLDPIWHGLTN
ncbi:MAG: hypothetical protein EXR68_00080 [Dehalococcoidia bacterium]|nr:hypothetical protein [Dehalococcoidia bacterium]